jgi:hypothetical protein
MNTDHQFLLSLLTEFRRMAEPHLQSPCAELMELAGVINEDARSVVLHQTLRRIHLLGWAAGTANARIRQASCHTLESRPADLMQPRAPAPSKWFDAIRPLGPYWLVLNESPPQRGGTG